MKVRMIFDQLK